MENSHRGEKGGKFELLFYSGYKGEEIPRAVQIGEREFKIDQVLERERVRDLKSGKNLEVFKCLMEGKRVKIIVFDSGEWSLSFLDE